MTLPNRCVLAIVLASAACNGAAGDGSAAQDQSDQGPTLDPLSHDKAYTKTPCGPTAATNGTIPLFSWAGTSVTTNFLDISDPVLDLTSGVYTGENDGLVGRCSAHFGKVLRDDYHMNHLDEVNQVAGLVSVFESSPVSVYRAHANRLKSLGL